MRSEEKDLQQVLLWKEFARLATGLEQVEDGTCWGGATSTDAEEYLHTALCNQLVMDAILKSIQEGGIRIDIIPSR